jgi:hypothetical protein
VDDYPLLELFWTILIIYALFFYILILFNVVADLFRDKDTSGWAKTGWIILFVVFPFLGLFIYLIARGRSMAERQMQAQADAKAGFDSYVQQVAGAAADPASQITQAKALLDSGAITQEEYEAIKRRALA